LGVFFGDDVQVGQDHSSARIMLMGEEAGREFGYRWDRMGPVFFGVVFLAAYIVWRSGQFSLLDSVFVVIVFVFFAIRAVLPLCKVLLTESEIHVSFLLPIQRGGRFRHDEIESYTEVTITRRGRKVLVCGFLQPKGRKKIIVSRAGTKGFNELSSILSEMFPKAKAMGEEASGCDS